MYLTPQSPLRSILFSVVIVLGMVTRPGKLLSTSHFSSKPCTIFVDLYQTRILLRFSMPAFQILLSNGIISFTVPRYTPNTSDSLVIEAPTIRDPTIWLHWNSICSEMTNLHLMSHEGIILKISEPRKNF